MPGFFSWQVSLPCWPWVPLPGRCRRLHLRPVRHGGLLGGLRGDLHFGLGRTVAELRANARLAPHALRYSR